MLHFTFIFRNKEKKIQWAHHSVKQTLPDSFEALPVVQFEHGQQILNQCCRISGIWVQMGGT